MDDEAVEMTAEQAKTKLIDLERQWEVEKENPAFLIQVIEAQAAVILDVESRLGAALDMAEKVQEAAENFEAAEAERAKARIIITAEPGNPLRAHPSVSPFEMNKLLSRALPYCKQLIRATRKAKPVQSIKIPF